MAEPPHPTSELSSANVSQLDDDGSTSSTIPSEIFSAAGASSSETGSIITADDFSNQGSVESTTTSFLSSISARVRHGIEENGRVYPCYGKNMYGMPMDAQELDRNDLQHAKFTLVLEGRLHLAPIGHAPQRILDLGTGTGIWAIDMADRHPTAQVVGVDIAPVQPTCVPPNCTFELEDVEEDWTFQQNSFDFIYAREFLTAIRDWQKLIRQSVEHLNHGGWLEMCGTIPDVRSVDHTIPANSCYIEAGKIFYEMAEKMGSPLDAPRSWKRLMEESGLVDVQEVVYKIPMGSWAKSKRLKQIGAMERVMLLEGLEAYLLRGYTQVLGRDPNVLRAILAGAKKEISDPKIHTYVFYHVVYGRKPLLEGGVDTEM